VQVDPGDLARVGGVLGQHPAQGLVAPGRCAAAVEQAVGKLVLPAGHRRLPGRQALALNEGLHRGLVGGVGRPLLGQQQRVRAAIAFVHRQRLAEVVEVAVQVHVLLRHAAQVREAVGIQRVDVQHRHASLARLGAPFGVAQREHLHAAAAKTLDAVAGAADDQQPLAVGIAVERGVQRQLFVLAPGQRVLVRSDLRAHGGGGFKKLDAGLRVAGRKGFGDGNHGVSMTNDRAWRRMTSPLARR